MIYLDKKKKDTQPLVVEEEKDYERMLLWHRRRQVMLIVVLVILVIMAIVAIKMFQKNKLYTAYEIKDTINVGDVTKCQFFQFGKGLLRYSNDGISYLEGDEVVWDQAFEMKQPVLDVCEDFMAIADQNGTDVYIYDTKGQQGLVEMSNPILTLEVAAQGVVAAITKGEEANLIEIYDKDGTNIAIGQTALEGDGVPLDISLSNDGTKLAASYVYLESSIAKTKVIFYNYSEVGKNEVGRIVGGFEHYETSIVSKVEFVTNDIVAAVGDDVLTFYEIKQQPSMIEEFEVTSKIEHVIYNEKYVALLLEKADMVDQFDLKVYSVEGKLVLERTMDIPFTDVKIENEMLIFNNAQNMYLLSVKGVKKYDGAVTEGIREVIPTQIENEFIIITDYEAEQIKLK